MEAGYVGYRRSSLRACALARKKSGAAAAVHWCGSAFFHQVLGNHSVLVEGGQDQAGAPVAGLEQVKGDFPVGEGSQHLPPAQAMLHPYFVLFVAFRRDNHSERIVSDPRSGQKITEGLRAAIIKAGQVVVQVGCYGEWTMVCPGAH